MRDFEILIIKINPIIFKISICDVLRDIVREKIQKLSLKISYCRDFFTALCNAIFGECFDNKFGDKLLNTYGLRNLHKRKEKIFYRILAAI
ncbi:hypothetical protein BpHYR1_022040 [Brachionus plicatilis]|uniref:Uncharacterized protein n=1 Tax=Brachionus plicatilis TaxID=10195 RepID=A0A3M7SCD6_BRAPC|nr:hypothetical protein BpHYR1_022040 [Brachionus plicatilis]